MVSSMVSPTSETIDLHGLIVAEAVAISREYLIENFSGAWCHLCRLKLDF